MGGLIIPFIVALLCCLCKTQDADGISLILRNIVDGQYQTRKQLAEQRREIKTLMEGQQEIVSSLQRCLCKDQISDFQDLLATDECDEGSHNCSVMANCTDTVGFYKCSCLPGYSGDGFTCQDIDECSERNIPCGVNEVCSNQPGSYSCSICQQGYKKDGNNCLDIDECVSGVHECHNHATCTNTVGAYNCECRLPYAGDGHTCADACETPSIYLEGVGCISLVSSEGVAKTPLNGITNRLSWDEANDKCKEMSNGKLMENIKVEHMELLRQHFYPLMGKSCCTWIGAKNSKWISSGLPLSPDVWADTEPDGRADECGHFFMGPSNPGVWDNPCARNTWYALCQSLY